MDASGLDRTLLVEVGLRLYFGPPARYLIGSNLGTNTLSVFKSIDLSPSHSAGEKYLPAFDG